jgi:5-methylcytosine-specific restriction enzyme subunit McrC
VLQGVPPSRDVEGDFRQWQDGRLMAHYRDLRPWCELVLGDAMPLALAGEWRGVSLLFPMEKLFERTVASALRRTLPPRARLTIQSSRHSLCRHDDAPMFRLEPDLLLELDGDAWVLDTKWKMLSAATREGNYGMSQSDMYQLFAYARHYLNGRGDLVMIYPAHAGFPAPLRPFEFKDEVRLWALPFDLDGMTILGAFAASLPISRQPAGA